MSLNLDQASSEVDSNEILPGVIYLEVTINEEPNYEPTYPIEMLDEDIGKSLPKKLSNHSSFRDESVQQLRTPNDKFFEEEIFSGVPSQRFVADYDYVIVFPVVGDEGGQSPEARFIMRRIISAGLELYPFLSVQEDEIVVLIRCPAKVLASFAEKSGFKMLTNPVVLEEVLMRGNPEKRIAPMKIRHEPAITPMFPYEHVYLKYQAANNPDLYHYKTADTEIGHFDKVTRLKLTYSLLTAPKRMGGCSLELSRMELQNKILAVFPLHDQTIAKELLEKSRNILEMPWKFPFEATRAYFGEKITLFYVFLGHVIKWILPVSVIGLIFQIIVLVTFDFSHPVLPIYTVIINIWCVLMLALWKRKQAKLSVVWGMTDYVTHEFDRPEFIGQLQAHSFINGKEFLYFPRKEFRRRLGSSVGMIFLFIMVVIGVIAAIYVLRFFLQNKVGAYATFIASVFNMIQILGLNLIYQVLAVNLTDQENHRTDTSYEDALIIKVFFFQFINSYASLFFLAFVAQNLQQPDDLTAEQRATYRGQCGDVTCMKSLAITLSTLILGRIVFKNLMDIFIPYLLYLYTFRKETSGISAEKSLTPPELDYILMKYDTTLDSVRRYGDTAIQFGYTVLFVAALPIATLLTGIFYHFKLKIAAWRLLALHQRPFPAGAQSIESWQLVFTLISLIAVGTNAGIITFTMDALDDRSNTFKFWVFIGFQWFMFCCQYITVALIPEEPEIVQIQKARMAAISAKIVDEFEDEDYEDRAVYESSSEEEEEDSYGEAPGMEAGNKFSRSNSGSVHDDNSDHSLHHLSRKASGYFRTSFKREGSSNLVSNKSEKRRIKAYQLLKSLDLEPMPVFTYPQTDNPNSWKSPICKEITSSDQDDAVMKLVF